MSTVCTPLPQLAASALGERCAASGADAIVVLAGDAGQERIIHALRLFKEGRAPVLVVTGTGGVPRGWRLFETASLFGLRGPELVRLDVPRGGTHGEAAALHADERGRAYQRLILVTSFPHSGRAARVFRRFGYDVCSMPATAGSEDVDAWGRVLLAREIAREIAAGTYYRLRGWA